MRPVLKIARQIDTSPEKIDSDMNRMINGIYDYAEAAGVGFDLKPDVQPGIVRSGICAASYATLLRVQPLPSTLVTVQMPQPNTIDGGKTLRIARIGYEGYIVLIPLGSSLINGRAQLNMFSTPGLIEILFDGGDFYTECPGAVAWAEDI